MLPSRSSLMAVGLLLWTTATTLAASIVPTNTTTWTPAGNKSREILLVVNQGYKMFTLQPLNNASYNYIPHSPEDTSGPLGVLYLESTTSASSWTSKNFALISCDASDYPGEITVDNVTANAISANVSAIIYYSVQASFCNFTTPNSFNRLFSTTIASDGMFLSSPENLRENMNIDGEIMTATAYNNAVQQNGGGNNPTTAVAMIILYSITGVITALFLLIIVTGAVRAHRHPERYGPRNVLGGSRQSRARGIARAMLDTIPIVKFGDNTTEANKDVDLELNASTAAQSQLNGMTTAHRLNGTSETAGAAADEDANKNPSSETKQVSSSEGSSSQPNLTNSLGVSTSASGSRSPTEVISEEGLGCSICTDDFEKGQDIRVLPCSHKFHPACVDPWLLDVSGTCPLCRIDLRPNADPQAQESVVGSELPPPLDPTHNEARRMSTLKTLFQFNRGNLQYASAEERIAALRRFRELNNRRARRTSNAVDASTSTEDANAASETGAPSTSEESSGGGGSRLSRLFRHNHNRRSTVEPSSDNTSEDANSASNPTPSGQQHLQPPSSTS